MSAWTIRTEDPADHAAIAALVEAAFAPVPLSEGSEAGLIAALRQAGDLTLSLVAEDVEGIVGHVAFSPITIDGAECGWVQMAPVSVAPDRQRQGIGGSLVEAGIAQLRRRSVNGIGVLGDPAYYERFGFAQADSLIVPGPQAEFYRALLLEGAMPAGRVRYAAAFG